MDSRRKYGKQPHSKFVRDVNGTICFDLTAATGSKAQHTPNKLKSREYGGGRESVVEPIEHLQTVFCDTWIDPRSGGLIGKRAIAEFAGVDERTVRRWMENSLVLYFRCVQEGQGPKPRRVFGTNVESLWWDLRRLYSYGEASKFKEK